MRKPATKHDNMTIALHWIVGLGIILLAGTELVRHEFPKGHFIREGLKPIHQPLGTLLFGLILARIAWRMFAARLTPDADSSVAGAQIARLVHFALYGLMIAVPLLGLMYTFGSGKTVDFGLFQLALPAVATALGGIAKAARELHEALGITILVLALFHAAAALVHHYVLKDGVLTSMRPVTR